ncbi:dihydroorotate dehydrogenase B catalytic subunit [bacterium (candidate division B38) B3_B38]|nr:MAG: dihydroorotate dehydrogenase B catalytic subunit [bacterium (candidate division B38) B3_B38]
MVAESSPILSIELNGLKLKNPIIAASGTFGYGLEYVPLGDLSKLGGMVTKGLCMWEEKGNPPPRICETPAGMLNSIGLENIGIENFITEKLPQLIQYDTAIIVNIWGREIDDYIKAAERLDAVNGIAALEVNISCPNIKKGGLTFGTDPSVTFELVQQVRKRTSLPLMVKLTPNVTDITLIARSAEDAGANALSLINTLLGMEIDVSTRRPSLANITGGLSGPAIRPVALRMVYQTARQVNIPIVGLGGISSLADVIKFLLAGASAVQIGTANFFDPTICWRLVDELEEYLRNENISDVNQLVGAIIEE